MEVGELQSAKNGTNPKILQGGQMKADIKKDYGWIELIQTEIIAQKTVSGPRRKNRQIIGEIIMF